jgi:LacI family transcriptional regulator
MRKITIQDIANQARVSTATVSRVLNKTGPVSAEMEERVLDAAAKLKFHPIVSRRVPANTNIGMVIAGVDNPSPQSSFFNEVINGVSAEANRLEATLSVAPLSSDSTEYPALLRRGEMDGLIVAGVPIADKVVESLNNLAVPVVFIGRYLEHGIPLNYVTPDNVGGGRIAARYLFDLGHRNILVLNGPAEINAFRDRLQGVQEVFSTCESARILLQEHFDEEAGYEATQALLDKNEKPTAILALSDWMAIGAMRALHDRGLRVPQDISVMGFSDLPVTEVLSPPLTTIRIPQRKLGALTVHLLHSLIRGEIVSPIGMVVPLELVVRQSTLSIQGTAC